MESRFIPARLLEGELRILGQSLVAHVHEIKSFLSRSRVPHRWLDSEQDQNARKTLEQIGDAKHAGTVVRKVIIADLFHTTPAVEHPRPWWSHSV